MKNPLKEIHITQRYGERLEYYKSFGINGHNRMDLQVENGTPVFSVIDGQCEIIINTSVKANIKKPLKKIQL